ncbi:MAG: thioredoxin-disulfide reductase [Candidatus Caldarchaeum sp.]|nr:thioredoxin-disulfide reductase [Candidatus Caldarchaeum sp.]
MQEVYDVIVIGGGPAGYTAAIYTCRANLKTLVIAGLEAGGQLMLTREVENYPGFSNGVLGPELMENMKQQAENQGAQMVFDNASAVDFRKYPFEVYVGEDKYLGKVVIVATGASPKWLGLEGEKRLLARGVSSCATCDGPLFRGTDTTVVVGGGDTAMEYALFLSNLVSKVYVVHRRDTLRASKVLAERAMKNPKIEFIWNSVVTEIIGENKVESVKIKNLKTGQVSELKTQSVFVAIGHKPNTEIFTDHLELDEEGYIKLYDGMRTNVPGVFAAGDVHDKRYRQAVTAAGYGCMAAMEAIRFLESGEAEKLFQTSTKISSPTT